MQLQRGRASLQARPKQKQNPQSMTFADQLRAERDRLNITRHECAEILGVSYSWVEKVERGEREPLEITREGALARLAKIQILHSGKRFTVSA